MKEDVKSYTHPTCRFPVAQPNFEKYVTCRKPSPSFYSKISMLRKWCNVSIFPSVYANSTADNLPNIEENKEKPRDFPVLVTDEEVQAVLAKETGRDRLREMYSKTDVPDWHGQAWSPQLQFVKQVTELCWVVSFVFGSTRGAKLAGEQRLTKHLTVKYPAKITALRRYYDAMIVRSIKMGFYYSCLVGAFTGVFLLISQTYMVYNNKSSFVEYGWAGGMTGSLTRIHIGPKAMFSGGMLGISLGTLGGLMILPFLKYTGETQEQTRYWTIYERLRREKQLAMLARS